MAECYMCNRKKTSDEHIPPKCIFPEKKDLSPGINLRKQLITVPSCDIHNSQKSKDDEFLLYSLVLNILNNQAGLSHFQEKLLRAIKRNPSLINQFLNKSQRIIVEKNKIVMPTLAIKIDTKRLATQFDHMGRALFYHEYGKRWNLKVNPFIEFLIFIGDSNSIDINTSLEDIRHALDNNLMNVPFKGSNPEVFKYQMLVAAEDNILFRLHFYGDTKVTLFLNNNDMKLPHGI